MYLIIKRILDFSFALLMLLLFTPVLAIISILIKIDSKGPILFVQKRIGLDRREFSIYKFRSMQVDTPNLATDKLEDPSKYITKIGRFLRKSSLDELPQLFNILKGDMSFIGPRPALYNQYELINMREKDGIHQIRPGLTGYAQVKGRDFISDGRKVEYDKYYLNHISLLFDVKVLIMTFFSVVKAEGVKTS